MTKRATVRKLVSVSDALLVRLSFEFHFGRLFALEVAIFGTIEEAEK
jgi:hypothetical protein